MTKLPIVKSRDLIKYLNSKGFVCTHVRGSHHVFRSQTSGLFTEVPVHGKGEIGRGC